MAGPKRKAAKSRRRRAPREELVDYIAEIDGWDWGYSLSLNTERRPADPYHEFRHLQVTGKPLRPAGANRCEVWLLTTLDMAPEQRKAREPLALGSLALSGDKITASLGIPADALSPILQMLIAGKFRYILMRGTKFSHRRARLHSFRLETKVTEDDMPPAS